MRSNEPATDPLRTPIAPERALAPYGAPQTRPAAAGLQRANAAFLASLVASDLNAETVRSRRRADPGYAVACYRASLTRIAA